MTDNPESANQLRRLDELITHNYSYVVFQALRQGQTPSQATASIDIPELDLEIEIGRHSFESMLTPLLAEIDGLINETSMKRALMKRQSALSFVPEDQA